MTILVVGATGATGKHVTEHLLNRGHQVKVVVRSIAKFAESMRRRENLTIVHASILDLSDVELEHLVSDCKAVASCLGHTLSFKGLYGSPRRLVTEATRRLCSAIKANNLKHPVKYVLMNTTGNQNRDLNEPISFGQKCVIGLLRLLLPPHVDNEKAADFLRTEISQKDEAIEWSIVRPDNLTDEEDVSAYEIHPSPTRSAIFDAGQTSRINVGHFMAELIEDEQLWTLWKGQMPVIYNKSS
ncbi:MAG: SDR family oxidoreductase [Rhodothermia bacterium]|nr:MAG: SDR family oxidoreductase [Rhodothermia bacterium]